MLFWWEIHKILSVVGIYQSKLVFIKWLLLEQSLERETNIPVAWGWTEAETGGRNRTEEVRETNYNAGHV